MALRQGSIDVRDDRPSPWRLHFAIAVALVLAVEVFLLYITPSFLLVPWLVTLAGLQVTVAVDRGRRIAEDLLRAPSRERIACAVADALQVTGLSSRGSEAVRVVDHHTITLCGVDERVRDTFAIAVVEALSPDVTSQHVVRRWVLGGPADNAAGLRAAFGLLRPAAERWHTVPTVFDATEERAQSFASAWDHWIGGDPKAFTRRSPDATSSRARLTVSTG